MLGVIDKGGGELGGRDRVLIGILGVSEIGLGMRDVWVFLF